MFVFSAYKRIWCSTLLVFLLFSETFALSVWESAGAFIFTDSTFSSIYRLNGDSVETLLTSAGAGRYATLSPDGKMLAVKIIENGSEKPALLDLENGALYPLSQSERVCGQPSFSDEGFVAFTLGEKLILQKNSEQREIALPAFFSPTK